MAEIKTAPTQVSVDAFLDAVEHPVRRADGKIVREMMERASGEPAVMWGPSIVGFGRYHYRYASGHEGDMCRIGFSPRAANLALYLDAFPGYEALLDTLGKHKRSKACLYLNKLADVDLGVLEEILRRTYAGTGDIDDELGPDPARQPVEALLPGIEQSRLHLRHALAIVRGDRFQGLALLGAQPLDGERRIEP